MRIFFILILALVAFILVVPNLIADVDLTPDTCGVAQAAAPISQMQVITIQESPSTTCQSSVLVAVTGGCANPYLVQSGDSLSQIAVNCNTRLVAIRQANPQVINLNLIYPGQQVNIPNRDFAQIPVTGKEEATLVASLPLPCTCDPAPIPVTGPVPMLIPGPSLQVRAINFPPNTPVDVAIGHKNTVYTVVTHGVTDTNENLTTLIIVPIVSNSETLWVVMVSTTTQPSIRAMSPVFNIDP